MIMHPLRIARPCLALALALTAALAFAKAARAGFSFPLGGDGDCASPDGVVASLSNPSTIFTEFSSKDCHSQCRRVVKDCKQYVNLATSCAFALENDYAFYQMQGCKKLALDPKACRSGVDLVVASDRQGIRSQRDAGRAGCDAWGVTCEASCGP